MSGPPQSTGRWSAVRPSLAVLLVTAATTLAVGVPAYLQGVRGENQKRFLKNYRVPEWSESYTDWNMAYVLGAADSNDVLFVGDSSCVVGVDPRQFTARTGLSAYNLGAPGFLGFEGFLLIVRRYLDHHPAPRLMVLCLHPTAFDTALLESRWPELRERFFWCYGEGSEARRPRHERPILDYAREGLRIAYGDVRGGFEHFASASPGYQSGKTYRALQREVVERRGFFENAAVLGAQDASRAVKFERLAISPKCATLIRTLIALAKERGILVIIRPAPILKGTEPASPEPLRSWLGELEREQPDVVVSRPEVVTYDASDFGEAIHCNTQGADRFTAFVAGEVIDVLRARGDGGMVRSARKP